MQVYLHRLLYVLVSNVFSISEFQNLFPNLAVDVDEVNREWQLLSDIDLLTNCDDLSDFWTKVATTGLL
jgi:membrane-bound lytic murein transglycosylase MltF